jgi:uncharacterized protein (TIRG00374 family)
LKHRFLIGIIFSAVLLGLLVFHYQGRVGLQQLMDSFRSASIPGMIAVVVLHLAVLSLKAVRWDVVLRAVPHEEGLPSDRSEQDPAMRWLVFDSLFLGYFGNYVLPAKLGELGRSLLYSRRAEVAFPAVLATIVFERVVDATVLVLFFYLAVPFLASALPDWVSQSAMFLSLGSVVGLGVLFTLYRKLPRDPAGLRGPVAKLVAVLARFREGLSVLKSRSVALRASGWTILIWGVECFSVYLCILSFGFETEALWTAAVLQTVISSFAIAAPSAPAGLGIHQWVTLIVLHTVYGMPENDALAVSLLVTASVVFWTVPLGLFGLARQGASMAELRGQVQPTG